MQCKVSINSYLLPTGLSVKVSGQTEYLSEVSKCWCPSGKVIFGQTLTGWTGKWSPWRQHCPSSWCSWEVWLGEQCRLSATGWDLFAWNRDSGRCDPAFCSHQSPSDLVSSLIPSQLGCQVQVAAAAAELWQFYWGKFYFFCRLVHPSGCCSHTALCVSLLKDMLPAVSWVVTIMATIKT